MDLIISREVYVACKVYHCSGNAAARLRSNCIYPKLTHPQDRIYKPAHAIGESKLSRHADLIAANEEISMNDQVRLSIAASGM